MRRRILVLNLALIMILSLLPFGALAANLQPGEPATYTKTTDSEHEIMTFTPPETGIYALTIKGGQSVETYYTTPMCLLLFSEDGSGDSVSTAWDGSSGVPSPEGYIATSRMSYLLLKGETYQFYLRDYSYIEYRNRDNGDWTYTMQKADVPAVELDVTTACEEGWYAFTSENGGVYQITLTGRWASGLVYRTDPYRVSDLSAPIRLAPGETCYVRSDNKGQLTISEAEASGTFGANKKLTWTVDNGVLRIDSTDAAKQDDTAILENWPWTAWGEEITQVELGAGVAVQGFDRAFDFENLEAITVDPENPNFKLIDGALYSADESELLWVANDTAGAFTVPESVRCVGALTFRNTKVTSVTIGENTQVRPDAFDGAAALKDVYFAGYAYGWDRMRVDAPDTVQVHCAKASDSITTERKVFKGKRADVAVMLYSMAEVLPPEPVSEPTETTNNY